MDLESRETICVVKTKMLISVAVSAPLFSPNSMQIVGFAMQRLICFLFNYFVFQFLQLNISLYDNLQVFEMTTASFSFTVHLMSVLG